MSSLASPNLVLLGGPMDTGNLGVSALGRAATVALVRRLPASSITVLDNGLGARIGRVPVGDDRYPVRLLGIRASRRIYRPESIARVRWRSRWGGRGSPTARALVEADAVLDVSGGDSFTDLYGERRFRAVTEPKEIVLGIPRPLIFLPQTIGPFRDPTRRARAREILAGADTVWTRDDDSFRALGELLGCDFDEQRHRSGVDLAFALEARPPDAAVPEPLAAWLTDGSGTPLAGVNVSGLLVNRAREARARFGLTLDYAELGRGLIRALVGQGARVVLVPHVVVGPQDPESDVAACHALRSSIEPADRERVTVAPAWSDPSVAKWLIAQTDWFVGARMHATIAALSSGVPASGVAYSDKIAGVFDRCGLRSRVADARALPTAEALDRLCADWREREATRAMLATQMPRLRRTVDEQLDRIARRCRDLAASPLV